MGSFKVKVNWRGEDLEVSGNFWKARLGMREIGTGLPLEPDQKAGFEIESVIYKGVDVVNLVDLDKLYLVVEAEITK